MGDPHGCPCRPAACAWLLRRFVDPGAELVFVDDPDGVPGDATAFEQRPVDAVPPAGGDPGGPGPLCRVAAAHGRTVRSP